MTDALAAMRGLLLAGLLAAVGSAHAATPPGTMIDVEAGKLYYETCGAGSQTLVLIHDGKTNWFEGFQLLAIYSILAIAFYFI